MDELDAILRELNQPGGPGDGEQRVRLCGRALALVSREEDPELWAALKSKLGVSLSRLTTGDRSRNVQAAIDALGSALEVRTRSAMPGEWATTMNNLAMACADPGFSDRAAGLEEAIGALRQVLEVWTRASAPQEWATVMFNLGNAYVERVRGDRADNVERAIAAYEQSLEVRTRASWPRHWAATLDRLGIAYALRVRGDRADNLERALAAHEQALSVRTRYESPAEWAATLNRLANVYVERVCGERAENLEAAIAAYTQALEVFTRDDRPVEWAATMHNLGAAWYDRVRGERTENLERAIGCYEQALEVRTCQDRPAEWASTLNNLGNAYSDRLLGDRSANLERAIGLYQQALQVRTREQRPDEWAATMHNLGAAYLHQQGTDRSLQLEAAIGCFEQALQVRTREHLPNQWAVTVHNLATAYRERRQGDRAENLERALALYQQALEVRTHEGLPVQWAATMHDLGVAYTRRMQGDPAQNYAAAEAAFRQALDVRTSQEFPVEHRSTQRHLGDLYAGQRRWSDALACYAAGLAVSHALYLASATPGAREVELGEAGDLPARAAYCLTRLDRLPEAVVKLEQGRARALREALARDEAGLAAARPEDRAAFQAARTRVAELEREARASGERGGRDFLVVSTDLRAAREQLAAAAGRIRGYLPDFLPSGLGYAEIADVARVVGRPLVYLLVTPCGGVALIVPPASTAARVDQVVWLDEMTTDTVADILGDHGDLPGYLYGTVGSDPEALELALSRAWPLLCAVMEPIAHRVADLGYGRAVIIPAGLLALLPLHAAASSACFSSAPSAQALSAAHAALQERAARSVVLVGIGDPSFDTRPLPFARLEVDEIVAYFGSGAVRVLVGRKATRTGVLALFPGATHVHFACHARFDLDHPLESRLDLAGEDHLSLRELLDGGLDLSTVRLAVLSACQTGIRDFRNAPDEAIGFPSAFLQAGIPGVVTTFWAVHDISTAVLLARFYYGLLVEDLDPDVALSAAQRWLRDSTAREMGLANYWERHARTSGRRDLNAYRWARHYRAQPDSRPFADPRYWAAFAFSGA